MKMGHRFNLKSDADALAARKMRASGAGISAIAEKFGWSWSTAKKYADGSDPRPAAKARDAKANYEPAQSLPGLDGDAERAARNSSRAMLREMQAELDALRALLVILLGR